MTEKYKKTKDETEEVEMIIDVISEMAHFKLKRDPFGKAAGDEVFRSKQYMLRLNLVYQWLTRGEMGCIKGVSGAGKTSFMNDLMERCRAEGLDLIEVGHPERKELYCTAVYAAIQRHFIDYGIKFPKNTQTRFIHLKEFLHHQRENGRRVGILVDEAHRLRGEFLRSLKEFTEMRYAYSNDLLGVLFFGQPHFLDNARAYAPDIYKRLLVGRKIICIDEMKSHEVKEYVRHRCRIAGNASVFDEGALNAISTMASSPLGANAIAWDAMDIAYQMSERTVSAEHVFSLESPLVWKKMTNLKLEDIANETGMSTSAVSAILRDSYAGKPEQYEKVHNYLKKKAAETKRRTA